MMIAKDYRYLFPLIKLKMNGLHTITTEYHVNLVKIITFNHFMVMSQIC